MSPTVYDAKFVPPFATSTVPVSDEVGKAVRDAPLPLNTVA